MLKEERQNFILSEITSKNKVYSANLSSQLNVSEDTIRRDLKELAEHGYLKKVHGGALANPVGPRHMKQQFISHESERLKMIKKCLLLIPHGSVIIIEGAESASVLAHQLPSELPITVITNSLPVCTRLLTAYHVDTFFIGGKISMKYQGSMGTEVVQNLTDIKADLCFMVGSGIHADVGITVTDREYAITLRAMMKASTKTIFMCLSKDVGQMQPFRVAPIDKISTLVTELEATNDQLISFREKGVDVL